MKLLSVPNSFSVELPHFTRESPAMTYKRKTWREKLEDDKDLPKVCKIDGRMSKRWGDGTFVIPSPREVDALMRRVPKGKITTIDEMRRKIARRHGTTIACPITTGIFAWIAAHASEEAKNEGATGTTPYWRTLKSKGELNPKYPGGVNALKRALSAEGHTIIQKGERFFVQNFDRRLAKL
jgi:alkylated DNA nucleotide flippase Atl1